ncbi:hypothetical protein Tco_0149046 [Tanacetum coccineum]
MGRMGFITLVRLELDLRGFVSWFLCFVAALGTSLVPLDQPWDAIVGLCLSLKEGDKEGLGDEFWKLEELECKSTLPTKGMRSIISTVSISLEGFLPSNLLLVVTVVIVAVILVVVVVAIVRVVIVVMIIRVVVVVTIIRVVVVVVLPSMLWGSPLMKASISFSKFGTMFGHKTANSWNILTLKPS